MPPLTTKSHESGNLTMPIGEPTRLIAARGFEDIERRVSFRTTLLIEGRDPPLRYWVAPGVLLLAVYFSIALFHDPPLFLVPVLLALIAVLKFTYGKLEIGHDGFRFESLVMKQTVSFSDVAEFLPKDVRFDRIDCVEARLKNGSAMGLRFAPKKKDETFDEGYRALSEAFERFKARDSASLSRAADRLMTTTAEEQVALVSTHRGRRGGYRDELIPRDELRALMEDPTVPARVRVAALAIGKDELPPEERLRVRAAFDASISPKVRVAAEEILDAATEEAIGASLRKLG